MIEDSARVELPPLLEYTKTLSDYNEYNISCYGMANGSIEVESLSGLAPFAYSWHGPDGFTSNLKDISDLEAGKYTLLITDSNYCTATEIINLTEPGPLGMAFNLSASTAGGFNINCAGDSTGTIAIEPLNHVKTVEYLWSDGITDSTRINLPAGDYSVIMTDENNCIASSTITLTEPDSLKLMFGITQPFCPDKPDGEIILDVTGGVSGTGYSYRWSDNSTSRNMSDIPRGFYRVIVMDKNGLVQRTGFQATYAYHMWLENSTQLSMGLALTGYHYKINEKEINFEDPNEPWLNNDLRRGMFVPDATFGVYLLNANYSVGFSADQLFEASAKIGAFTYNNFRMSRHYYLFGSYSFSSNSSVEFQPSFLLMMSDQFKPQADIGVTYIYNQDFWAGLAFRTSGALIANVGVKYNNMFIGYAFDFTLQEIQRITYGTHEITLAMKFGDNSRRYRWLDRY